MADVNGYTPLYAIDLGTPPTADVTLSDTDSAATIQAALDNTNYNCIAFNPGDYRSKGAFTLNRSGTASTKIWLRLAGTGTEYPWKLAANQQAVLLGLTVAAGNEHIVLHRLVFEQDGENPCIYLAGCSHVVVDKCEGRNGWNGCYLDNGYNDITVQYSYFHEMPMTGGAGETGCILIGYGTDAHIVCCELHDANNVVQVWDHGFTPSLFGCVVENCDIYFHEYMYNQAGTQAYPATRLLPGNSGTYTGEDCFEIKSGADSSSPALSIHNRIWNAGETCREITGYDDNFQGSACWLGGNSDPDRGAATYWRWQDCIVMDCVAGFGSYHPETNAGDAHISVIGCIFYNLWTHPDEAKDLWDSTGVQFYAKDASEIYLCTFIECERAWIALYDHENNCDIRGCVIINCGEADIADTSSNRQIDYNVFYGTPVTTTGTHNLGSYPLPDWAATTAKSIGDMVKNAADGVIMICRTAGTTGATEPDWSSYGIGGEVNDGTVVWQIIRGPYTFYRKLLTGPESFTIPYALPHTSAPEANFVPTYGEDNALGSRTGIGVNDDIVPNGILAKDLLGNDR